MKRIIVFAFLGVFLSFGFVHAAGITLTPADYVYDENAPRGVQGDAAPGWGTGSFQGPATGKSNFHLMFDNELVDLFGAGHNLTVGDLASISFWTKSTDFNWWLTIYTMHEGDGLDSGSWYDSRLHAYPGAVTSDWTEWNTNVTGELLFYDTPRGLNGLALSDMVSGSTSHDYSDEVIRMFTIQSNSGWDGFDGQIDGLTITLSNGTVGSVNLEPVPEPATMLLLGTGLIGLAGARRKLKK